MEMKGYYTKQGLELSAKLGAGSTLIITRIVAGSGTTEDPYAAVALPQPMQELAVNSPIVQENMAILSVILTAALAESAYTLREVGIFADDPDEGEILYKLYQLSEPVEILPASPFVLQFFLKEPVSPAGDISVVCWPDGLLREGALNPLRSVLTKTNVSERSVQMEASELQAFLDGLPRLLTEHVTVTVSGTLDTALNVNDFYGSGSIIIQADPSAGCTFRQCVQVNRCDLYVGFADIQITEPADGLARNSAMLSAYKSRFVQVNRCILTGAGSSNGLHGVTSTYGGRMVCENCTISGFENAVMASRCGEVLVNSGSFDNNGTGAYVWNGGIIILYTGDATLGGSKNTKQGGIIVKADGTLL